MLNFAVLQAEHSEVSFPSNVSDWRVISCLLKGGLPVPEKSHVSFCIKPRKTPPWFFPSLFIYPREIDKQKAQTGSNIFSWFWILIFSSSKVQKFSICWALKMNVPKFSVASLRVLWWLLPSLLNTIKPLSWSTLSGKNLSLFLQKTFSSSPSLIGKTGNMA